jgi:hypothetical protein
MFFCRIIRGKSKLSVDHTVESHAFLQDKPLKVKTFRGLSCGKFQYTEENQNLPTSKANFRQKFNHGGSVLS